MNKQVLNFFFIGHIALDTVIKSGKVYEKSLGGSVCFCSISLKEYMNNVEISIISNFNKHSAQKVYLDKFKCNLIDLEGVREINSANTEFILDYHDHSRKLTLKSKAPNLRVIDIPDRYLNRSVKAIGLVPICCEISYEYVANMLEIYPNAFFGIDVQGFIREIDSEGHVSLIRKDEKMNTLTKIIKLLGNQVILKGAEEEMKLISNREDYYEVMDYFKQYEGIYIMTLGEKGSMISKKGEDTINIPAYKANQVVDETGAGDVYFAIFLYEFLKSDKKWEEIKRAGYLASAAASFGIEKKGVDGFQSKKKVKERFQKKWGN